MPKNSHKHSLNRKDAWNFAYLFIIIIGVVVSFMHKAAQREVQTALKCYKKMSYDDVKLVVKK